MNRKPMLAGVADVLKLKYPLYVSPKLDGVRALTSPEGLLSRALKRIPNAYVQDFFNGLPDGLDGELIFGSPTAHDVYRQTVSLVMAKDKQEVEGLHYYLFDIQTDGTFEERRKLLERTFAHLQNAVTVRLVPVRIVRNEEELLSAEAEFIAAGYEGAMLNAPGGHYKHGRSSTNEGLLLKLKRFLDSEARVLEVVELMHNANEAETNELGRTKRSSKKEGLVPAGTMGALLVEDISSGVRFEIGTGFTAAERASYWRSWQYERTKGNTDPMDWPLVKYKYFPVGVKDKPRHPVYLGWRAADDRS